VFFPFNVAQFYSTLLGLGALGIFTSKSLASLVRILLFLPELENDNGRN